MGLGDSETTSDQRLVAATDEGLPWKIVTM